MASITNFINEQINKYTNLFMNYSRTNMDAADPAICCIVKKLNIENELCRNDDVMYFGHNMLKKSTK